MDAGGDHVFEVARGGGDVEGFVGVELGGKSGEDAVPVGVRHREKFSGAEVAYVPSVGGFARFKEGNECFDLVVNCFLDTRHVRDERC